MNIKAIVIGASAGGISAIKIILGRLSADFPWPIFYIQHLGADQDAKIITSMLTKQISLQVKEAEEGESILPHKVYLAPANKHMLVRKSNRIELSITDKVKFFRPSIDVTFKSAAAKYKEKLIGVILTGANDDGADGLKEINKVGGYTVVQEPLTATVDCMPKSAIKKCSVNRILTPYGIGMFLKRLAEKQLKGAIDG
ncbi:MAG: chemotaxis protein CheB [Deltaproteobacteria bacterium]|nr:chemotaxis protein CheB [Deltaproteobacteria bacterium]